MKRSEWFEGLLHCEALIKTLGTPCQKGHLLLAFYQDYADTSTEFQNGFLDCIEHYANMRVIS